VFDFDNGAYGGYGDISNYAIPTPAYLGFSGRTGGATNNQYAICVRLLQTIILRKHHCCCSWVKDISTSAPPPPAPALSNPFGGGGGGAAPTQKCGLDELAGISNFYCPPSPPGGVVPTTCPPGCATRMVPWLTRCTREPTFRALDASLNRALSNFRVVCMAGGSSKPQSGGH